MPPRNASRLKQPAELRRNKHIGNAGDEEAELQSNAAASRGVTLAERMLQVEQVGPRAGQNGKKDDEGYFPDSGEEADELIQNCEAPQPPIE